MGPTLATGKQGWDKLIGRAVAGLPSHRPGKQEEKAAKPPAEKEKRRELVRLPANGFPKGSDTAHWGLCKELIRNIAPPLAEQTDALKPFQR